MNIVRCNRVFYYNKLNSEPSKRQVTCRLDIVDKRQRAVSKLIGKICMYYLQRSYNELAEN
jgi:hypothetical protein